VRGRNPQEIVQFFRNYAEFQKHFFVIFPAVVQDRVRQTRDAYRDRERQFNLHLCSVSIVKLSLNSRAVSAGG
jgi:hypothetical protein